MKESPLLHVELLLLLVLPNTAQLIFCALRNILLPPLLTKTVKRIRSVNNIENIPVLLFGQLTLRDLVGVT